MLNIDGSQESECNSLEFIRNFWFLFYLNVSPQRGHAFFKWKQVTVICQIDSEERMNRQIKTCTYKKYRYWGVRHWWPDDQKYWEGDDWSTKSRADRCESWLCHCVRKHEGLCGHMFDRYETNTFLLAIIIHTHFAWFDIYLFLLKMNFKQYVVIMAAYHSSQVLPTSLASCLFLSLFKKQRGKENKQTKIKN